MSAVMYTKNCQLAAGSKYGLILAIFYICDQFINLSIGSNVGATITFFFLSIFLVISRNFKLYTPNKYFVFAFALTLLTTLVSYFTAGCGASFKSMLSFLLLGGVVVSLFQVSLASILLNDRNSKLIFAVILVFLVSASFGFSPMERIFGRTRYSDPFMEDSHLAIYILPIISYRLIKNWLDLPSWIIVIVSFLLASSSTLLISLIGIMAISLLSKRLSLGLIFRTIALLVLLIILILISSADIDHHIERITVILDGADAAVRNLSAWVWLNGWSQAYESFQKSDGIGLGFNQMGCGPYASVGIYSEAIVEWLGVVANIEDGSFMASKLISELGVFGVLIVLSLTVYFFREIFKVKGYLIQKNQVKNQVDLNVTIAGVAGSFSILIFLFVRGAGYFLFPVLLAVSMVIAKHTHTKNYITVQKNG